MAMDVKALIEQAVKALTENRSLLEDFKADPVKTIEGILKVDLPEDTINAVISGVKAKLNVDGAAGLLSKLKGLFKK